MRINIMPNLFVPSWIVVLSFALILINPFSAVAEEFYTFNQLGQDLEGDWQQDYLGYSVALSNDGKSIAVGATGDNGVNGWNTGDAKVYKLDVDDGLWLQMGQDLDGEYVGDKAGFDVDLSADGQIVAVGAILNDGGAADGGHVRVFEYNGTSNMWEKMGGDLDGEDVGGHYGRSLALSADGQVLASSGSNYVTVHRYDGTTWNILGQEIERQVSGFNSSNSMLSLSPDGTVIALGEYSYNQVRVFQYEDGTGWSQMGPTITGAGNFGWSVSLSNDGTILGIGAYTLSAGRGAVHVFEYNGAIWNALGSPLIGNENLEHFGYAVEVSNQGNRIAVGGLYSCNTYAGRVALFEYDGVGSWIQLGDDIYGEDPYDSSGNGVALSGDGQVIAHGTHNNDNNGYSSGHARVFQSITTSSVSIATGYILHQLGQDIDGEAANDLSGSSVALSNEATTLAIGAYANKGSFNTTAFTGHARVYKFDAGSWIQMGQDLDGEGQGDLAGYDIDLSANGQIVAVGAPLNDEGEMNGGHVRVFEYDGSIWQQMGKDLDGNNATKSFGSSLALSADGHVVASAGTSYIQVHKYNGTAWNILGQELVREGSITPSSLSLSPDGSVLALGEYSYARVRVFKYGGDTGWSPMGPTITGPPYFFGWAVSLSSDGTVLGVGNYRRTSGSGYVYMYQYNGNTWSAMGSPLKGNQLYDYFGASLEVSSDGQRVAVGSYFHDGCYYFAGKANLYEYDGVGSWVQVGRDLLGEGQGDNAGFAVAISPDGGNVAFGAIYNDGNGVNSGHVQVYGSKRLIPGARGDPHFKTWDGESYDFHGLCDLVLLQNRGFNGGLGMDLQIRTKKMKQWSYISNAALRIGEDIFEIMAETNGKTASYWINGVAGIEGELTSNALLPDSVSGYPVYYRRISTKQHEFTVDLGDDEKIVVKTWQNLVRVDIHGASKKNFGESLGLMGSFSKGSHVGRDGITVFSDLHDFGQEWQVLSSEPSLFHSREGPQAPEKCVAPSSTKLRRRLSESMISQEKAMIACSRVDEADRDMCVFDVMATNDADIGGAY